MATGLPPGFVGVMNGSAVGTAVGSGVGSEVGSAVGSAVGTAVGTAVGLLVGLLVGLGAQIQSWSLLSIATLEKERKKKDRREEGM